MITRYRSCLDLTFDVELATNSDGSVTVTSTKITSWSVGEVVVAADLAQLVAVVSRSACPVPWR